MEEKIDFLFLQFLELKPVWDKFKEFDQETMRAKLENVDTAIERLEKDSVMHNIIITGNSSKTHTHRPHSSNVDSFLALPFRFLRSD